MTGGSGGGGSPVHEDGHAEVRAGNAAAPAQVASARWWPAALLRVYPAWWRDRYRDEVESLVADLRADGRRPVATAADLLRGAVTTWLIGGRAEMSERIRGRLLTVLWCWAAFAGAAGFFGHDLAIYPNPALAQEIAAGYPAVPAAFYALEAAGAAGLAVTLIAAVAFAVPAARQAVRERRHGILALMAIPPAAAAIWIGVLRYVITPGYTGTARLGIGVFWLLAGLAGAALSLHAVGKIIQATEFSPRTWRIGFAAAGVVTCVMLAATGATIAWGLAVRATPAPFADAAGWLTAIAIMAVASGRSVLALAGTRELGRARPPRRA